MVKDILTGAGFVEDETFKETRFLSPPKCTYAVYMDSFKRRGPDGLNLIKDHTYAIELYSTKADPTTEANIEKMLDKYGIEYDKSDREFLESEQLFMVVYTFDFIEK